MLAVPLEPGGRVDGAENGEGVAVGDEHAGAAGGQSRGQPRTLEYRAHAGGNALHALHPVRGRCGVQAVPLPHRLVHRVGARFELSEPPLREGGLCLYVRRHAARLQRQHHLHSGLLGAREWRGEEQSRC